MAARYHGRRGRAIRHAGDDPDGWPERDSFLCHGNFVLSDGQRIAASASAFRNVAGRVVIGWKPDER